MRKTIVLTVFVFVLSNIADADLIGYWDFEEGGGTTALDSSGNNLNGSIYNAVYTEGRVGSYALDFNGSNSFVEVLNNPLLNSESISISLWFNPREIQVMNADILDKGHGYGSTPYYGGYVFQYNGVGGDIVPAYGNGTEFCDGSTGGDYRDNCRWDEKMKKNGENRVTVCPAGS